MRLLPHRNEHRSQLKWGGISLLRPLPSYRQSGLMEGEPPVFGWLGRTVVRHPWWTIVAWVIAAAAAIALAPKLDTHSDQQDFLPTKYESVQAGTTAHRAFPSGSTKTTNEMMVVKRSDGQTLTTADQQKIAQTATSLQAKHIPNVTAALTGPPALARDHRGQIIAVPMPVSWSNHKLEKKNGAAVKQLRAAATQEFR